MNTFDAIDSPLAVLRREHKTAGIEADRHVRSALRDSCAVATPLDWSVGFHAGLVLAERQAAREALRLKIELGAILALHEPTR